MVKGDYKVNRSRCKICKWLRENRFARSQWNNEVSRGDSLGELQTVLRTLGLEASKSTISRHLVECEHLELYESKIGKIKKSMKKPFKKLNNFFIKPTVESSSSECRHLRTTKFFDMPNERVVIKCLDCGKNLMAFNPEVKPRNTAVRDTIIINAIHESRRMRKRKK